VNSKKTDKNIIKNEIKSIEEPVVIEVKELEADIMKQDKRILIILLAYLSPETLWDMQYFDFMEIHKLPHFIESVELFLENTNIDTRNLFIINAINKITKKNVRVFFYNI
jgi:hypothetical protein